MIVGYLGDIPFLSSRYIVRTFDGYQKSASGRWATHDIIGKKPILEFLGPGQEEISFDMTLRTDLGVVPADEVKRLEKLRDTGEAVTLVIGTDVIGNTLWTVDSVSSSVKRWGALGMPTSVTVNVTLKEYAEDIAI